MNSGIKKQVIILIFNSYKDKFKKIAINALKEIDLFKDKSISEDFIENIFYDLDYVNYNEGSKLFNEGDEWTNIKIILGGFVDILMKRNNRDIYWDTLYWGCSIGAYTFLSNSKYTMRAEATSDMLVLIITKETIEKHSKINTEFKHRISEINKYVAYDGLPFLDYKIFRSNAAEIDVFDKFHSALRRLIRINKSYKLAEANCPEGHKTMKEEMRRATENRAHTKYIDSESCFSYDEEGN